MEAEDGWYKLNSQLIVKTSDREDGRVAWLAFPDEVNRAASWRDLASSGETPINDQALTLTDDQMTTSLSEASPTGERITLTVDGNEITLVRRDKATLPDFARYYDATLFESQDSCRSLYWLFSDVCLLCDDDERSGVRARVGWW